MEASIRTRNFFAKKFLIVCSQRLPLLLHFLVAVKKICLLSSILYLLILSGCATTSKPTASSIDAVTSASPIWGQSEDEIPDSLVKIISAYEVRQKQLRDEDFLLVDVRSKESFIQSHIQDAISLPLSELWQRYQELQKGQELILYCGGNDCPLSKTAAKRLIKLGFFNVKDMQEGIAGWEGEGFPTESGP